MLRYLHTRRGAIGRLLLLTLGLMWLGLAVAPCAVADALGSDSAGDTCIHEHPDCCDRSGGQAGEVCPVMQVADSQPDTQQPWSGGGFIGFAVADSLRVTTVQPSLRLASRFLSPPCPRDDPAQRFRVLLI